MYFGFEDMIRWFKELLKLEKPKKKPVRRKSRSVKPKKVAKKP